VKDHCFALGGSVALSLVILLSATPADVCAVQAAHALQDPVKTNKQTNKQTMFVAVTHLRVLDKLEMTIYIYIYIYTYIYIYIYALPIYIYIYILYPQ